MSDLGTSHVQTAYRGPILVSVKEPLERFGFPYDQLLEDRKNEQFGTYRVESYLLGSANLALLQIPPREATEANLLIGPSDERRANFSFKVYTLDGDGELRISIPGSHDVTIVPLYPGAPVIDLRPGEVYAYRAGVCGLTVLDFCDPAFEQGWERPVVKEGVDYEEISLPERFWDKLDFE